MPTTGSSRVDPTGLRRQIARERAADDAAARADWRREREAEHQKLVDKVGAVIGGFDPDEREA